MQWDDYNYDYDENSSLNKGRYAFNPKHYRFVKLVWSESDKTAEYTFKFNGTRRGLWIGAEPPRGEHDTKLRFMLPASSHIEGDKNGSGSDVNRLVLFGRKCYPSESSSQPLHRNSAGHEGRR